MIFNGYKSDLNDTEINRLCKIALEKGNISAINKYALDLYNGIGIEKN